MPLLACTVPREKNIILLDSQSCWHQRYNENVDAAAKGGLLRRVTNIPIPEGDFRITRCEESVLARILIGHTYLTHSFLLKKEDTPQV